MYRNQMHVRVQVEHLKANSNLERKPVLVGTLYTECDLSPLRDRWAWDWPESWQAGLEWKIWKV